MEYTGEGAESAGRAVTWSCIEGSVLFCPYKFLFVPSKYPTEFSPIVR